MVFIVVDYSIVQRDIVYTFRKTTLPGDCRGRYAPSQRQFVSVVIARHEVPRQSVGVKYGVYAANFIQGDRHVNCYSALNACALKLSFFAFFVKNASALWISSFANPCKQVCSLDIDAKTVDFPCHRERKRGDPLEKVRGIYSVLYSKGLPRHFVPRNDNRSIVRWDISLRSI